MSGNFWLGGTDEKYEDDWIWPDGSRVAFGTPFWALKLRVFGKQEESFFKSFSFLISLLVLLVT